jgi:hypothetical protein
VFLLPPDSQCFDLFEFLCDFLSFRLILLAAGAAAAAAAAATYRSGVRQRDGLRREARGKYLLFSGLVSLKSFPELLPVPLRTLVDVISDLVQDFCAVRSRPLGGPFHPVVAVYNDLQRVYNLVFLLARCHRHNEPCLSDRIPDACVHFVLLISEFRARVSLA